MNKIGIIVGVVALALAGYLAVSLSALQKNYDALALEIKQNTTQDSIREVTKPDLPDLTVDESNLPIAYVENERLMEEYLYVKDIKKDFDRRYNRANNTMIKAEQDFMARVQDLQDKIKGGVIKTEAELNEQRAALAQEEQSIMQRKQKHSMDLAKKEQELGEKLKAKIDNYLKKYSSEFHYSYILTKGPMSNVLFASDSLNITDEIIEGLNADYKKNK